MVNYYVIFISIILGFLFKNISKFPKTSNLALNQFVIFISLSALIFLKFPILIRSINLNGHWWVPISMSWLTFILSFLIIAFLSEQLQWSKAKTGALILCCGLGNTSFVGFPILESILGSKAISIGILADQPGSFFIVSTLGILIAAIFSGEQVSPGIVFKRLFFFPPFLAMLISFVLGLMNFEFDKLSLEVLEKFSNTLVPLALFAVGFQTDFKWSTIKRRIVPLSIGLSLKLLILPLFFYLLYWKLMGINNLYSQVTILESAMATQITAAVVVTEFNLDSELANLMVGLSIPISIMSVPLFNLILFS